MNIERKYYVTHGNSSAELNEHSKINISRIDIEKNSFSVEVNTNGQNTIWYFDEKKTAYSIYSNLIDLANGLFHTDKFEKNSLFLEALKITISHEDLNVLEGTLI